jgi:hypothetical protein
MGLKIRAARLHMPFLTLNKYCCAVSIIPGHVVREHQTGTA